MTTLLRPRPSLNDDPICTTGEAAYLLGVSVSTAQLWMEKGALASWKTPGGHRRCRFSDIVRLQGNLERPPVLKPAKELHAARLFDEFMVPEHIEYPLPAGEKLRLTALADSELMDSDADNAYDRITWLATQLTGCPMALVSLLSAKRQWFKSRIGVEQVETPRAHAFCSFAILDSDGMVVEDARSDPRFCDNPLVLRAPHIRFYAGMPVRNRDGYRFGTLCVLDSRVRTLTPDQVRGLRELADIVTGEITRRG